MNPGFVALGIGIMAFAFINCFWINNADKKQGKKEPTKSFIIKMILVIVCSVGFILCMFAANGEL